MKKKVLFGMFLFLSSSVSMGRALLCDNKRSMIAEKKLVSVEKDLKKSKEPWLDLALVFELWEPCLGSFQDEAFIDVIANLVVTRWDKISDLKSVKSKKPKFYKYILSSLADVTVGKERWAIISDSVNNKCPDDAKDICKDIAGISRAD